METKTAQHTPGPWAVERNDKNSYWSIVGADARRIAESPLLPHEDAEANAQLIAAAPELLEALRRYTESDGYQDEIKMQGLAAIAKAEGRG